MASRQPKKPTITNPVEHSSGQTTEEGQDAATDSALETAPGITEPDVDDLDGQDDDAASCDDEVAASPGRELLAERLATGTRRTLRTTSRTTTTEQQTIEEDVVEDVPLYAPPASTFPPPVG